MFLYQFTRSVLFDVAPYKKGRLVHLLVCGMVIHNGSDIADIAFLSVTLFYMYFVIAWLSLPQQSCNDGSYIAVLVSDTVFQNSCAQGCLVSEPPPRRHSNTDIPTLKTTAKWYTHITSVLPGTQVLSRLVCTLLCGRGQVVDVASVYFWRQRPLAICNLIRPANKSFLKRVC